MPFVEYRRIPTQWEFFLCNSKRQPTHHHHSSTNPSSPLINQPIITTHQPTHHHHSSTNPSAPLINQPIITTHQPTDHHHSSTNPSSPLINQPIITTHHQPTHHHHSSLNSSLSNPSSNPSSTHHQKPIFFWFPRFFKGKTPFFFSPSKKTTPKLLPFDKSPQVWAPHAGPHPGGFPSELVFDATYNTTYFKREPGNVPLKEKHVFESTYIFFLGEHVFFVFFLRF